MLNNSLNAHVPQPPSVCGFMHCYRHVLSDCGILGLARYKDAHVSVIPHLSWRLAAIPLVGMIAMKSSSLVLPLPALLLLLFQGLIAGFNRLSRISINLYVIDLNHLSISA